MIHYHAGFDYFSPEAGQIETAECKACGDLMKVERNVLRTKSKYGTELPPHLVRYEDIFTCSNAGQTWHTQIITLIREAERTPSRKIADLIEAEIQEIKEKRQPTKEWKL